MDTETEGRGTSRDRNANRVRARMGVGLLAVAVAIASCGGEDRGAIDRAVEGQQTEDAVSGDFEGNLESDRPASREIALAAGDALRVWAKPTPAKGDEPVEISLALSAPPSVADALTSASSGSDWEYSTQFFSAYPDVNPEEFGVVLFRTAYYSTDGYSGYDPPWYHCYGRGWGRAAAQGTWLTFVAPVAGTYSLLVAGDGIGPYEIHVDTETMPDDLTTSTADEFDTGSQSTSEATFSAENWDAVLAAHNDYLYDRSGEFFPPDGFFTDYEDQPTTMYGPDVAEDGSDDGSFSSACG